MGMERNTAFAGTHLMDNGVDQVRVEYFDLARCRAVLNPGIVHNNPKWRPVGWYWSVYRGEKTSAAATWHGKFTASSLALRDAEKVLRTFRVGVA